MSLRFLFSRHRQRAILPLRKNDSLFVDISNLGLDSKIKKSIYSFIFGKGYSPPFGGRIAFCLQSESHSPAPEEWLS